MNKVNYDYYSNVYSGNLIPEEFFAKYIKKAEHYVTGLIFGRDAGEYEESVKLAICSVAELMYIEGSRLGISNENSDGYSVSYNDKNVMENIYEAVCVYLADSGLMYSGGR